MAHCHRLFTLRHLPPPSFASLLVPATDRCRQPPTRAPKVSNNSQLGDPLSGGSNPAPGQFSTRVPDSYRRRTHLAIPTLHCPLYITPSIQRSGSLYLTGIERPKTEQKEIYSNENRSPQLYMPRPLILHTRISPARAPTYAEFPRIRHTPHRP